MSNEKRSLDPNVVIVAVIGLLGTIAAALIGVYGNRASTSQPTGVPPTAVFYTNTVQPSPIPTDTVPAGDATSTPEPATPTPTPNPTPVIIPVGADWQENCISTLWLPYPSSIEVGSDDKGCLIQPVDKFYTTTDRLAFSFNEKVSSAQIYGMFAKLPSDGTVELDVHLITVNNGEVLMGVFESPDVNSKGALVVIPSSNNVTKKQKMILKTMPGQKTFSQTGAPLSEDPPIYDASFDFNGGNVRVRVNKNLIDLGTVSVVSGEKWLFLGYQVVNGTNAIQAEFLNLKIQSR